MREIPKFKSELSHCAVCGADNVPTVLLLDQIVPDESNLTVCRDCLAEALEEAS